MAARGKGKASSAGRVGAVAAWAKVLTFVVIGVVGGYVWRSYFPLALPFESRLVSDRTSEDMGAIQLRELARVANERAEKEAREKAALQARLRDLEQQRSQAELNLGDMQIRSLLSANTGQ